MLPRELRQLQPFHDRLGRLLDRQGHGDIELLEVAGVLHGDPEREIGRCGNGVVARRTARIEPLAVGQRRDGDEGAAVVPTGRPSAGRRAVDAQPHLCHRLRACELGVRDHVGIGDRADVGDVLVPQLELRWLLEVEVPVDVAGDQETRLVGDQPSRDGRVARVCRRCLVESVGQPAETARTELEHLDQVVVLDAERAGRVHLDGRGHHLLLLRCETLDLRLEIGFLDSCCTQGGIQVLADLIRALRDDADVLDVPRVLGVLAAGSAAAHTYDDQNDGQDQKGDQPRQAEHRDQALGRAYGAAGAPRRRAPGRTDTLGRFLGLGLVEEVEFDVGVAFGHGGGPAGRVTAEAAFTLTRTSAVLDE